MLIIILIKFVQIVHVLFFLQRNGVSPRDDHDTLQAPSFLIKFLWLIYRYLIIIIRDPKVQLVRILQKLVSVKFVFKSVIRINIETCHLIKKYGR